MTRDYISPAHDEDVWAGNFKKPRRVLFKTDNNHEGNIMLLKQNVSREDNFDCWKGEGYYRIAYSDGGQDYTCDGPVWFESYLQIENAMEDAWQFATPTHLPYSEYLGVELPAVEE